MRRRCVRLLLLVLAPMLVSTLVRPASAELRAVFFVSGLTNPVQFVQDPARTDVQYVVEQGGLIRTVVNGAIAPTPFLDLRADIVAGGEQGLLGAAFPADYAASGRFYVNFTNREGHTVVARFRRHASDPLVADPSSRFDLQWPDGRRFIEQPFANHNGGKLLFGSDGYLYIGMGDGGGANDPQHRAQDPTTLLGKMLRIDVSVPDDDLRGYRVPPTNPFAGGAGPVAALGEIWAFGLRNPWRFSEDPVALGGTGALLIADVGQGGREEVDYQPPGAGGRNYGWRNYEGTLLNVNTLPPAYGPLTVPLFDYGRTEGQAIAGGVVYRGTNLGSSMRGRYFYADFVSRRVWSLGIGVDHPMGEARITGLAEHTVELSADAPLGNISSIDIDARGEMYLVDWSGGRILRIASTEVDMDADGLPDTWESAMGLDPASSAGADGPDGDPDADGRTNAQEFVAGTHPRGFHRRYFAEGSVQDRLDTLALRTYAFFDLRLALLNPNRDRASVVLQFLKSNGTVVTHPIDIPPTTRATVDARTVPGLVDYRIAGVGLRLAFAEFSTIVESDVPVVVDRTMTWDETRYGAHSETGIAQPAISWYLAEGATHFGFDLYYLVQNPNASPVEVDVRYLLSSGPPITKRYVVSANSRFTIRVGDEDPRLASAEISASITSSLPTVVERAMYLPSPRHAMEAGHASAAVTTPATRWLLAEGATGDYFDLYVLVANPTNEDAVVEATYLLPGGQAVVKSYGIPANSRFTIWVDKEDPQLADTAVSTVVRSSNGVGIVVERAMWWPGPTPATWASAHVSAGVAAAGQAWAVAEGEDGGGVETYILIANTSPAPDAARVTLTYVDGITESREFLLAPTSRTNVPVRNEFPGAIGRRFGAVVEALGANPAIVVERAMYYDSTDGTHWAAGANAVATRIR